MQLKIKIKQCNTKEKTSFQLCHAHSFTHRFSHHAHNVAHTLGTVTLSLKEKFLIKERVFKEAPEEASRVLSSV